MRPLSEREGPGLLMARAHDARRGARIGLSLPAAATLVTRCGPELIVIVGSNPRIGPSASRRLLWCGISAPRPAVVRIVFVKVAA
jgi:hypothetical protein